jgi:replicative DNA helicase
VGVALNYEDIFGGSPREVAAIAPDNLRSEIPPHDLEAERGVLGSILIDEHRAEKIGALDMALGALAPEDFYGVNNEGVFRAMGALAVTGGAIDALTLTDRLRSAGALDRIGGAAYIAELASTEATARHIASYIKIVRNLSTLRRLAATTQEISSACYDRPSNVAEFAADAECRVQAIGAREARDDTVSHVSIVAQTGLDDIQAIYDHGGMTGLSTGLIDFDAQTGGLQKGDLMLLAARPRIGKTALAINIAEHVSGNGAGVAFFSLEMQKAQLIMRMFSWEARVSSLKFRTGGFTSDELVRCGQAFAAIAQLQLYIDDDAALSPLRLKTKARRIDRTLKSKGSGLGLIVVDYIQLMTPNRHHLSREQEVSEISRYLKQVAKEFNVPVLALCQLNRSIEKRGENPTPQLSDLRESGQLEQDADVIAFLTRDIKYDNAAAPTSEAKMIVVKQRSGPEFSVDLLYLNTFTKFQARARGAEGDVHEF